MTNTPVVASIQRVHPQTHTISACVALVVLTVLAFFGVWENGFVNYDDNIYVFMNPDVVRGMDWQTVKWASTYVNACHWIPITWLSHAFDCQLYGLNPAGHHLTSLIFHAATVVLLFLALKSFTGSFWRSVIVAALFGVHPLRVESVAWVAERKDVLSAFFGLLSLLAYARYCRSSFVSASNTSRFKSSAYVVALICFAFALMSKPMLVTLPCVLLALDYWPLQRFDLTSVEKFQASFVVLVKEKIPFLLLSGIVSMVTFLAQESTKGSAASIPIFSRLTNGVAAVLTYLTQTFWPKGLAIFYPPQPFGLFSGQVILGVLVILGMTLMAVRSWKTKPYFTFGWIWFVVTLLPVSGIVQAGDMIQADRYTYIPCIGILIMLVWSVEQWASGRFQKQIAAVASIAAIVGFGWVTHLQVAVWKNTETLFSHAAKVTRNNHIALAALADIDLEKGRIDSAKSKAEGILSFAPGFPHAEYLVATVLQMQGKMQEAIPHLERSVGVDSFVPGRARMVLSLLDEGRLVEADAILSELMSKMPHDGNLAVMKAAILRGAGQPDEAAKLFNAVTQSFVPPVADTATLNYEIAELYSLVGKLDKAQDFYRSALERFPDHLRTLNNFAWMLATSADSNVRNGILAVRHAEHACELSHWNQPIFMGTLAAAYAEVGRFDAAIKMAERARGKAQVQKADAIAIRNSELLELYRSGKPHREP